MKAKRETPVRRSKDRRRGRQGASSKTSVELTASRRTRPRGSQVSSPAREPRASRSGPQTTPMSRPVERPSRPKSASQAKARAKARKAKAPKVVRPPLRDRLLAQLAAMDLRPRTLASKVPFVVLVIGSLGVGLCVTLWLSTDSAERSYQLGNARVKDKILQQQKEALERDVLEAQSAPALAEAARKLGMIPTQDTAHLVQDPSGNWVVVGTPKPAQGAPPPPLNTRLPDEKSHPRKPPGNSVETPVLVAPGPSVPIAPAPAGPEVLVRAPDGASTLGTQHLPSAVVPGSPNPAVAGPAPGSLPAPAAAPPVAEPPPVGTVPAAPPVPVIAPPAALEPPAAAVPQPPASAPEPPVSAPQSPASAPQAAASAPQPPVAAAPESPAGAVGPPPVVAAPVPPTGEQFGPVTATTPGAAR
ncbi:MAG: hypothetical protein JOZ23_00015 [Mycobacterium sp.]|nr:hypothetical protein [Mycobacterium sp.]